MTVTSQFTITEDAVVATGSAAGPAYVDALLNGEFIIVQDHSAHVHTQVYNSVGTASTPEHQINFGQLDTQGPTAMLTSGNVVVLSRDATTISFTIQNYAGGVTVTPTTSINVGNTDQGRVVALASGGFVVTYRVTLTGTDTDVYAKVYDAAGALQTTVSVDTSVTLEDNPTICNLVGGGFVVAWESVNSVRYAIFNDNGTVRTSTQTLPTTGTDQNPALVALADGGFAFAYQTNKFGGADIDIALARFTSAGVLVYDKVILDTADAERLPSITLVTGDILAIGYTDVEPSTNAQTLLAIVDAELGTLAGEISIGSNLVNEDFASVTTVSDGSIVAINTDANGLVSGGVYSLGARSWTSDSASDAITGSDGVDVMFGGEGNDSLFGGDGNDTLDGSDGIDVFIGGFGDNRIIGGRGPDTVDYRFAFGTVVVNLQLDEASFEANLGGVNTDILLSIENVLLGDFNDFVFSSDANNFIDGGAGNDSLDGAYGDDTIIGGFGNDTVDGGGLNDMLDGGSGKDSMIGGGGSDLMVGGSERDTMTGEGGSDTFDFNAVTDSGITAKTRDTITDFSAGRAATFVDKLDLFDIDAIPGGANNAFQLVSGGFTAAGQITVTQVGLDVLVRINTTGTSGAEMSILLLDVQVAGIAANDFIL